MVIYLALLFGMRKDKSGAPMNRIMSMRYRVGPNLCRNNMYRKSAIARIRKTMDSFFFTFSPPLNKTLLKFEYIIFPNVFELISFDLKGQKRFFFKFRGFPNIPLKYHFIKIRIFLYLFRYNHFYVSVLQMIGYCFICCEVV